MALVQKNKLGLLGLIVGICLGLFLRTFRVLYVLNDCSLADGVVGEALKITPMEFINLEAHELPHNSPKNLVLVGVMTAKSFLRERTRAVYETWGQTVPGRIAFFSSEGSPTYGMPVISLKGVDDRYPPQKKSFMMLHYMYEHYIDKFEWFIRADDDVFVRTDKLEMFLRSIDSSKPQFIGQAGKGNTEEFGLLSLEYDENFCMGGPGVIFSRETLRRVAPHIPTCLKNLYSTHEDVEVGRCVQKFAGIPCTWNYEMQSILHHNASGNMAFTGNLKNKEVHSAITMHPVKKPQVMYRLHVYTEGLKAQERRQEALLLHRDVSTMVELLHMDKSNKFIAPGVPILPVGHLRNESLLADAEVLGQSPKLKKGDANHVDELFDWNYLSKNIYSAHHSNPKHRMETALREGLEDVIREIMENINNFSRQRGRIIEFKDILYAYDRVNALHGQDLILDLLLVYKKYRGKKMTVQVRRHLYVQRSFTDIKIREYVNFGEESAADEERPAARDISEILSGHVKKFLNTGLEKLIMNGEQQQADAWTSRPQESQLSGSEVVIKRLPNIVFILPLVGRPRIFQRFLANFEEVCLLNDLKCDLLVALYVDTDYSDNLGVIEALQVRYPHRNVWHREMHGNFSRGFALDEASRDSRVSDNDILFFVDVDITFTQKTLDRIRGNTIRRRQVYLPIVFSEYNPNPTGMFSGAGAEYDNINDNVNAKNGQWVPPQPLLFHDTDGAAISNENGYFREFGYGLCAIFKADLFKPGIEGFVNDVKGWGLEDVKFLDRIIASNREASINNVLVAELYNSTKARSNYILSIFRTPDPSLRHIFHAINCDKGLEENQYKMCLGTKANTMGSYRFIEQFLLRKNASLFPVRRDEDSSSSNNNNNVNNNPIRRR